MQIFQRMMTDVSKTKEAIPPLGVPLLLFQQGSTVTRLRVKRKII